MLIVKSGISPFLYPVEIPNPIHKKASHNDCRGVHPPPSISHFSHFSLTSLSLSLSLSLSVNP
ncbi:hypothetical protein ACN42_g11720, partial [Penicillium freii]